MHYANYLRHFKCDEVILIVQNDKENLQKRLRNQLATLDDRWEVHFIHMQA